MFNPRVQYVLYANALFCLASAMLILLLPGILAEYVINLPGMVFRVLGMVLVLFAIDVFLTARKAAPSRGKILYLFSADLAWVLLTPVVMAVWQNRITGLGNWILVDIALIVAAFAALEWQSLKRMAGVSGNYTGAPVSD